MNFDKESTLLIMEQHPIHAKFLTNVGLRRSQAFTFEAVNCERAHLGRVIKPYNPSELSEPRMDILNKSLYQAVVNEDNERYYSELNEVLGEGVNNLDGLCSYVEKEYEATSHNVAQTVTDYANVNRLKKFYNFSHERESLVERLSSYIVP